MKIGFDGKRVFQNSTGLGNYSRSLIAGLATEFPQHRYGLFAPKQTGLFNTTGFGNIDIIVPHTTIDRRFPAWWRSSRMVKDIAAYRPDIFHGLSNELPAGIEKAGVKSVITVHDLIFERYPESYHFDQRYTHRWKMKRSCQVADAVIAASVQTKKDLVDFYQIPGSKIVVCYQNCNPLFEKQLNQAAQQEIKKKYQLPDRYFLFVSSVTQRKNLLDVCKAMVLLKDKLLIPLVVIGDGKKEKNVVKNYLSENSLEQQVIFLNETAAAKTEGFSSSRDFPGIYQQALALVYPSVFEGFGIPLLEALWSRLPVISSNSSSLPEVGGDAALYFTPGDINTLADQMMRISKDTELQHTLKEDGSKRAKLFTAQQHAKTVMDLFVSLL